jgi:hypothetical protein
METNTRTAPLQDGMLGVGSILVASLPAALLTDDAPDRYTVEGVFTRKPSREEIAAILSPETRDRLSEDGYSTVEVTVSDRRLVISNTNLEELRSGLATLIAEILFDIDTDARASAALTAGLLREATEQEHQRAAAVVALAAAVAFTPRIDRTSTADDDLEGMNRWEDESGASHL